MILRDLRDENDPFEIRLQYEGGISSYIEYNNKEGASEPIHRSHPLFKRRRRCGCGIALQYNDSFNEMVLSFANNIRTGEGGTHEAGFKAALTRVMNDYARRYKIIKEDDKNLTGEDVREGLTAIVSGSCRMRSLRQTKAKLGNTGIGLWWRVCGRKAYGIFR